MSDTVIFEAREWLYEETSDEGVATGIVHISGLTAKNENVAVKIVDFKPFVYLQLPKLRRRWNRGKRKLLIDFFRKRIASTEQWRRENHNPTLASCDIVKCVPWNKYLLHYSKKVSTLKIFFSSNAGCRTLENICSRAMTIPGVGVFKAGAFVVHESNVDPVIKLTAINKILLSGWVKITGERIRGDEKFNSSKYNILASWKDMKPTTVPKKIFTSPKFCSFDIECNSTNHNSKLPDANIHGNVIFQIACVFGRIGQEGYNIQLLSLFDPLPIEGTTIIRCKSEKDLLLKFSALMQREDPDLFLGYNTMKFDWNYMLERAKLLGCQSKFLDMSRSYESKAKIQSMRWFSAAYGQQEFSYPQCIGRMNVDILLEVQMNFRLPKYSLNAVAEKFLGEQKDDITPRQLFMLYQITYELLNKMSGKVKRSELVRAKKYVERVMLSHHCHGVVEELRASILAATPKNIYRHLQEAITLTGSYCVQDTILPIKLLNKLNLWTTMKEMSNVMHIPSSYLHTRGQQIKVLAQVYRETIDRGYIIPHQSKLMKDGYKKTTFQGATVIDAVTGDYDNVGTLDFASLYPTVMISFNICYTTFVAPDDPTPDEECHILEWSEHVKCGCPKDKKLPKDKKKKRYCAEHRYRFRKVQIEIDDEGNVIRHHEGLLPRLERNLLATRKEIKREMAKVDARLAMNRGKADAKAIEFYRDKCGYEIIEKGSLSAEEDKLLEITAGILNAKQLAVKVSCNSVAGNTPVPCLVDGVFTYLAIEDLFDKDKFEEDDDENQISKPLHLSSKKVKVWSDNGWTDIKYVMRHKVREPLVRVLTHTGCVDVTPEHSLLRDTGESVTSKELSVGDTLMHNPLPHTSVAELCDFVRVKGGLNAAKFFHSMSMKDYKVTINRVEGDVYEFRREPADRDRIYNSIVAIMPHNRFDEEEYIYDIETKNHHFAAGVGDMIVHNSMYGTLGARTGPIPLIEGAASVTAMGRSLIMLAIDRIMKEFKTCMLVYGDTDSCMIHFKGASLKQSFKLSIKAGKIATHYLKSWIMGLPETYKVGGVYTLNKINPKSPEFEDLTREEKIKVIAYDDIPIDLEFENMYGRFLLLTKKRYLALSYNEDGKVVSKTKKGVVITRRDNSNILKRIYTDVSDAIMEKRPKNEVYQPLYDGVDMLFSRRVPEKDFIIYMGVKDVMGYAKKKKLDETKEDGKEYYVDKDGNPIVNPVGPLDPRLNYPNIPQCLLSLKMIGRGTDIPPNTRLEFLYVRNSDAQHQGDKAEDYLYYKENKLMEGFKIDELHYLEKQILKPVTELLVAKFPPKEIPYENCKDALTRVISSKALLGEYRYNKLYSAKTHTRVIAFETGALDHVVGWTALRHVSKKRSYMRFIDGKTVIGVDREKHRVYTHRTLQGKVWSIFDSVKAGGANDFNPKYEKDREAVDVAKRWWSRQVLDRNYKHYGMKRRPEKRPSTAVKKVPIGTKVSLLRNYEGVERLTVGEVVCMYMESEEDKAPVLHDIIVDVDGEKKRLEAVPRDVFTPFIKVDSKPVHDMFVARKAYRQVLDHLEELFSPFSYID